MKYSEVVSIAVQAALGVMKDGHELLDAMHGDSKTWFAMYQAQCCATDEFKSKADAKSDATLKARVEDLENDLMIMNKRYSDAQQELMALKLRSAISAANSEFDKDSAKLTKKATA